MRQRVRSIGDDSPPIEELRLSSRLFRKEERTQAGPILIIEVFPERADLSSRCPASLGNESMGAGFARAQVKKAGRWPAGTGGRFESKGAADREGEGEDRHQSFYSFHKKCFKNDSMCLLFSIGFRLPLLTAFARRWEPVCPFFLNITGRPSAPAR